MKFSFKRFLGFALAAVMTVYVLNMGMVISVNAIISNKTLPNRKGLVVF